jgi:hypothetical protein
MNKRGYVTSDLMTKGKRTKYETRTINIKQEKQKYHVSKHKQIQFKRTGQIEQAR